MTTKGRRWIPVSLIALLAWGVWVLPALSAELTDVFVERVKSDTNVIIRGGYSSYRAFTLPEACQAGHRLRGDPAG